MITMLGVAVQAPAANTMPVRRANRLASIPVLLAINSKGGK